MIRRGALRASVVIAAVLAVPAAAAAQPYIGSASPRAGSLEISAGATWTGGYDAGSADARLTRPGAAGTSPLTIFNVSGTVAGGPGAVARLGVYLTPRVSVEGTMEYSRPLLRAHLSGDFELAANTDAEETTTSYLAGGSVVYHFGTGHFVPFVSGGAGYLRQLHEENSELLSGTEIHGGGGMKYWLATGRHRVGLRADAQVSARSKAAAFEQKRRVLPSAAVGLAYLF